MNFWYSNYFEINMVDIFIDFWMLVNIELIELIYCINMNINCDCCYLYWLIYEYGIFFLELLF